MTQERTQIVKVYADGVFDLVHSGHFNALRQAKALGDHLVVGINSDEDVLRRKGIRTIYSQDERAEMVMECKWVDEILTGTPYTVTSSFLEQTGCNFIAHGDDMPLCTDGADCYASPRRSDRVKLFKRTEGISSSAMLQRLLRVAAPMVGNPTSVSSSPSLSPVENSADGNEKELRLDNAVEIKQSTLLTTRRLGCFIGTRPIARPTDRVVYVDGSFDVFHVGHVRLLKKAKELGDFLIVGLHDDSTVEQTNGPSFPVMNLLERTMNVLAMKMVDEVIIGASPTINEYLINSFGINVVVRGNHLDARLVEHTKDLTTDSSSKENRRYACTPQSDPYELPKSLGIYEEVVIEEEITTLTILQRIAQNRDMLKSNLTERVLKESDHYITGRKPFQET